MTEKLVKEWISKAEEDYRTVLTLNRQQKHKLPNSVCFHCQHCIEKYSKAILVYYGVNPPRSHDLRKLNDIAVTFDTSLDNIYDSLEQLNSYSVEFRYPGESATFSEAKQAVRITHKTRKLLIEKFRNIKQLKFRFTK